MRPSLLVFAFVWVLITGWTFHRLWRKATDRYTDFVYKFGVKGFGLGSYALSILLNAAEHVSQRELIIQLLVWLPFSLWGGYLFGRVLAWSLNVKSHDRAA